MLLVVVVFEVVEIVVVFVVVVVVFDVVIVVPLPDSKAFFIATSNRPFASNAQHNGNLSKRKKLPNA